MCVYPKAGYGCLHKSSGGKAVAEFPDTEAHTATTCPMSLQGHSQTVASLNQQSKWVAKNATLELVQKYHGEMRGAPLMPVADAPTDAAVQEMDTDAMDSRNRHTLVVVRMTHPTDCRWPK